MKKLLLPLLLLHCAYAFADAPLFNLVPQGALPTTITPTGTATAKYTVTNNTPYALQKIGLVYVPSGQTPIGVTQSTAGVNTPPTCGNSFTLNGGASCTLVLTISGANLVDGRAVGGPELCYTTSNPSRCSVPTPGNQLNVVSATTVNTLSLAAGTDQTGSELPFLVQSNDAGVTWSVGVMPGDLPSTGFFRSSACSDGLCFAAGHDGDSNIPLLVQTTDQGTTWVNFTPVPTLISLTKAPGGVLEVAACNSSDCVTAGQASGGSLILYTLNNGTTWTKVTTSGLTSGNSWNTASCSTGLCIVAGVASSDPVVGQSLTGTGVWTLADLSAYPNGRLSGSACLGDYCLVGGDSNGTDPLLIQTYDAGSTWTQFDLSTVLSGITGLFRSGGCASNICIAAGEQTVGGIPPLLIQSTDGGSTWALADLGPTGLIDGSFQSASCSTTICVAAGGTGSPAPMLVYSADAGTTWVSQDFSSTYTSGVFASVSCDGDFCIAAGAGNNGGSDEPFLVQTSDAGNSWSVITVAGAPTQGNFNGSVAAQMKKLWKAVKSWL